MYVASAHAHVGDANDHIVRILDDGQWLLLESCISGSIEQTRWVLHFERRRGMMPDVFYPSFLVDG